MNGSVHWEGSWQADWVEYSRYVRNAFSRATKARKTVYMKQKGEKKRKRGKRKLKNKKRQGKWKRDGGLGWHVAIPREKDKSTSEQK